MLERVSNLLLAGEPSLRQDNESNLVWRVSIHLTFPSFGRVGHVGDIDVGAHNGELHFDEDLLIQLETKAREVAQQVLTSTI